VYPALAVLQALGDEADPVLWVGSQDGMEAELVKRYQVNFTSIPAGQVHGISLHTLPRNLWQLTRGVQVSRRIIQQFKPDVLFYTGGFVAVPMAIAGHTHPSVLYVPDIEPGWALQFMARFASRIAVTTQASQAYFPRRERVVVTGYPTRKELTTWQRQEARQALGLRQDLPVLLVAGGSKGARSLNQALQAILPDLLPSMQVLHLTGHAGWETVTALKQQLPQSDRYHPLPYLHEMGQALASADLVVSRAGASTLAEYPLFGLPAILVPYPYAWRYQKVNAAHLVDRRAAVLVKDEELRSQLLPTIRQVLGDPEKLAEMRTAMQTLAVPGAADAIAGQIRRLANGKQARSQ